MATKGQARLLTYSVMVLNLVFVLLAVAIISSQGRWHTLGEVRAPPAAVQELGTRIHRGAEGWRPLTECCACAAAAAGAAAAAAAAPSCLPPAALRALTCRALGQPATQVRALYRGNLIIGCVCLAALAFMLLWLGSSLLRLHRERRVW